ncbi:ParB/RepB/Spo0J family partition protein [Solitalea koreensis]|uniref:Chromosome partitioning protein, ParB family n=1 Tax=Solitalea koreensis TaxID=543615 RepID=A0A521AEX6_9SPHI|nr:ParB/RepB/Spo0J family partition protein [Solitalea koreensis]SMO33364.1 chromosome partitioning protein, ParB family [Solitalea koreensis]
MSVIKKSALGKGLGALLAENDTTVSKPELVAPQQKVETAAIGSVSFIQVDQIEVNPFQPRTDFDELALGELAESIKLQGIIQPLTVRKMGDKSFQLISGERRLRASKIAGLTEVPAYIRLANDQEMLEMGLIENIQREDLNAIEIAISFQRMVDEVGLKQEELGERVSKNRSTVTNYLRLLKLPPVIQAGIRDNHISMGHARAIINVGDIDKQLWIYRQILEKDLSVRKVEELVRELGKKPEPVEPKQVNTANPHVKRVEDGLSSKFGTRVALRIDEKGKGRIEIPVLSNNDLNRILEIIG